MIFNTIHNCFKVFMKGNPKSSHHKEKKIVFLLYLQEMLDVHSTYHSNHFMMYVSHVLILYRLHLPGPVCQLHLNKTGRKESNK